MENMTPCTRCGKLYHVGSNFCIFCGGQTPSAQGVENRGLPGPRFLTKKEMLVAALIFVCSVAFLLAPVWVPNLSNDQI